MTDTDVIPLYNPPPDYMITTGVICSSLSLVGSGCMIVSYLMTNKLRQHFYYFWVFHLAIADFLISTGGMYDWTQANQLQCDLFSVILGQGLVCSYFFIIYVAFVLYYSTSRTLELSMLYKKRDKVMLFTYIFVMVLAVGPLFTGSYGQGATYCWLKTSLSIPSWIWLILEYYIPILATAGFTSYLYKKIYQNTRYEHSGFGVTGTKYVWILLLIPGIYCLTNIISVIDRILFYLDITSPVLQLIHILLRQLQGFYHAIIYGYASINYSLRNETVLAPNRYSENNNSRNPLFSSEYSES